MEVNSGGYLSSLLRSSGGPWAQRFSFLSFSVEFEPCTRHPAWRLYHTVDTDATFSRRKKKEKLYGQGNSEVNIYHFSPTLRWILDLVYTTQENSRPQTVILFCDKFGKNQSHFVFARRWIAKVSGVWVANQSARKADYSELSLRRTPSGPALAVRLKEVSAL